MKQLEMFNVSCVPEQNLAHVPNEPSCATCANPKRRGACKEVLRAKVNLYRALDRMLREYPKWSVEEINEHVFFVKKVRLCSKLHQLPELISTVRKYTLKVRDDRRSRIKRDLELADRWHHHGISRVLREKAQADTLLAQHGTTQDGTCGTDWPEVSQIQS